MAEIPGPGQGQRRVSSTVCQVAPRHIAVIMDGNGRWANSRGLPRVEGHRAGEVALMDTVAGAQEAGVKYLSMYAFSTENWNRSPAEVRFLMGYSRDVIRRRIHQLNQWNVRVRWLGRTPRLWKSVIRELQDAEEITRDNTGTQLLLCVNYGGRAEIADAARELAEQVEQGKIRAKSVNETTLSRRLYAPDVPDVDLLIRTSGERRLSNFLLWQMAYAEFDFVTTPWPEFGREQLWQSILDFASRDRRFGGAADAVAQVAAVDAD